MPFYGEFVLKGSAPKAAAKPGGPPKKAPPASSAAAPPKKTGKAKEEIIKYKFSSEEVEDKFAELVPEDETADLGQSNWKLRLAGILS